MKLADQVMKGRVIQNEKTVDDGNDPLLPGVREGRDPDHAQDRETETQFSPEVAVLYILRSADESCGVQV